uniref:Intron-binding protein aquarius n=1 Tax=Romanomermis culicivorax TaxID=13658 RepID=A0A915IU13_ROMCU
MPDTMSKKPGNIPTVNQIAHDRITQVAAEYWAPYTQDHKPFDANVVAEIYNYELVSGNFSSRRIMLLEFSQYLEYFLWPNYDVQNSSVEHVLSIVVMINEKFRERVPAWNVFKKFPEKFAGFFKRVTEACFLTRKELSVQERTFLIVFLINCVGSVEVDLVRSQLQKFIGFPIWTNLLETNPRMKKFWNALQKADAKLTPSQLNDAKFERQFLYKLIEDFCRVLHRIPAEGEIDPDNIKYCERFLEFLIDIESLLPTRRFFNTLMNANHVICKCRMSNLVTNEERRLNEGKLFNQLLEILEFYARFEIDDNKGEALKDEDVIRIHYNEIANLQKVVLKSFKEDLKEFYLSNVSSLDTKNSLLKNFSDLKQETLYRLCEELYLVSPAEGNFEMTKGYSKPLLLEILVYKFQRRLRQLDILNEMPLYPTEDVVWDENLVPTQYYNGEGCLALNKLNLQFLTIYDYLLRNFRLFRLESTYEIRQDIEDAVFRMKPWRHEQSEKEVVYGGWARMALPIANFNIVEVLKPNIGERSPASVRADIIITLNTRSDIRAEWEALRKHDVCFLITIRPKILVGQKIDVRQPLLDQIDVVCVRGCEIEGMLGPDGKVIEEFSFEKRPQLTGNSRTFRVWLDCNQYRLDMEKTVQGHDDVYENFNLIIRRKPKENNFKAVLDTIRQLMNTECVVPDWLHDILLGYGDPAAAHYSKMPNAIADLDFNDTFLDADHVKESFLDFQVTFKADNVPCQPPFKLHFSPELIDEEEEEKKEKTTDEKMDDDATKKREIIVETYSVPSRGPYPYLKPRTNAIRFTPTQIEAIKSGMQPGLTMVVGPPGTGKTDVAVQIISNIYHNWPEQRTLIITHSNQALNQLFEKIMNLDIDERHLLRLGYGEEMLETEKDFSRYGRVNYVLAKRLELLKEVERMQVSLGVKGDVAYTCETAQHFYLYQIYARWEDFLNKVRTAKTSGKEDVNFIAENFPFNEFFSNAPQPLFHKITFDKDLEIAMGCWRHLTRIFKELDEFRAFELLRSGRDRTEYLLVKEAKIIAMTCTHAALRRRDLVELGF